MQTLIIDIRYSYQAMKTLRQGKLPEKKKAISL